MLSKIVIRNVGLLKAFDTPNAPRLSQLTLFYGRNGRGKSTLTAVLRAARDGTAATVLERQSLGNSGATPKVTLISTASNIIFESGVWNTKSAPIEVFDTTFIADNVFAGELVDLSHDRGLFSLIIGAEGVRLANHLEKFNALAKTSAAALKETENAFADDFPAFMSKEEFFALVPNSNDKKLLDAADLALKAVQQADKIAALQGLETLTMPDLPNNFAAILPSTIADIDASARVRLVEHFRRFALDKTGEAWINYGIEHIQQNACPLCGRDHVDAEGMVTLYGQIFGETYKAHLATITKATTELEDRLGEDARTELARKASINAERATKWGQYLDLGSELPDASALVKYLADTHRDARALTDRKRSSPLEVIEAADELSLVNESLASAREFLKRYNAAVGSINEATSRAVAAAPMTVAAATLARDDLKKRMARHDPGVKGRINAYLRAKRRNERARTIRTKIQKALKNANEGAAEHYHQRVNYYLGRFSARFTISKITNSMQGNAGQADYGLFIKGEAIARGRGRQAEAIPTFRNTLSAGDKTTLAFAFFLAKVDHDTGLSGKTLVIDDPLSSHDSQRRRETVSAIKDLCARCRQVIVLSHDEFLLREVERRCVGIPSAAFKIDFTGGDEWSSASAVDLDQLCRAEHVRLVDEIIAFIDECRGNADHIVHHVRRVLETHYRRSYMAYFPHDRNLGQIVKDIAAAGPSHPCHRDVDRLDDCNVATCDRHHGEDAIVVTKQGVDPDSLRVIASDALELIGARRKSAAAPINCA